MSNLPHAHRAARITTVFAYGCGFAAGLASGMFEWAPAPLFSFTRKLRLTGPRSAAFLDGYDWMADRAMRWAMRWDRR